MAYLRNLEFAGRLIAVQVFTINETGDTYTKTSGTNSIMVFVTGGGGSGSAGGANNCGGGGGGGGTSIDRVTGGVSGVTVTVGAGGAIRTGSPQVGLAGGASSFGSYATATGGIASPNGWSGAGKGGLGADGLINLRGDGGEGGQVAVPGYSGGGSYWGGAAFSKHAVGEPGGDYGGGGSGSLGDNAGAAASADSGAGGDGVVVVYEYS